MKKELKKIWKEICMNCSHRRDDPRLRNQSFCELMRIKNEDASVRMDFTCIKFRMEESKR